MVIEALTSCFTDFVQNRGTAFQPHLARTELHAERVSWSCLSRGARRSWGDKVRTPADQDVPPRLGLACARGR